MQSLAVIFMFSVLLILILAIVNQWGKNQRRQQQPVSSNKTGIVIREIRKPTFHYPGHILFYADLLTANSFADRGRLITYSRDNHSGDLLFALYVSRLQDYHGLIDEMVSHSAASCPHLFEGERELQYRVQAPKIKDQKIHAIKVIEG